MDWVTDGMIIMALAIIEAGAIAGGVVSYRGSSRVGVKAFGAAAVAVGVVMWAVVLIATPVSHSSEGLSAPIVAKVERVAGYHAKNVASDQRRPSGLKGTAMVDHRTMHQTEST